MSSVIERVRRLLALAQSDNEHEAAIAMEKAQKLIHEHRLSVHELEQSGQTPKEPAEIPETPSLSGARVPVWKRRLLTIIADANGCMLFSRGARWGEKHFYVVGRTSDVEIVNYLFAYVMTQMVEMAAKECRGKGRSYKDQWFHAAIQGLKSRLAPPKEVTTTALAIIDERKNEAEAEIDRRFKTKTTYMKAKTISHEAYVAGQNAAARIDVNRNGRLGNISGKKALP